MTIDISKYRLLTPAKANFNIDEDISIYMRGGDEEVIKIKAGDTAEVNLFEIRGVQTSDFNLAFKNHTKDAVKEFTEREDFLQALYYFLNFNIGDWVEVFQHNKLTFFDAIYADDDEQPDPEDAKIVY